MGLQTRFARPLITTSWAAFLLATTHWYSWTQLHHEEFANDTRDYEAMASSAPHLPATKIPTEHAQRLPLHWLVGELAHGSGIGIHPTYRILAFIALGTCVVFVHRTLVDLNVNTGVYATAIGALITNAYAFRFLLLAPTFLSDSLFLAGSAALMWSLLRGRSSQIIGSLAVCTVARETGLMLALASAVWLLRHGSGTRRERRFAALAAVIIPAAIFVSTAVGVRLLNFSRSDSHGFVGSTIVGTLTALPGSAHELASQLGQLVLGLLPVLTLLGGAAAVWASQGSRHVPAATKLGLLLAASVLLEPISINDYGKNATRVAVLALPALVVAYAALAQIVWRFVSWWGVGVLSVAIGVTSLHHRYAAIGPRSPSEFLVAEILGCIAIGAVFAAARRVSVSRINP